MWTFSDGKWLPHQGHLFICFIARSLSWAEWKWSPFSWCSDNLSDSGKIESSFIWHCFNNLKFVIMCLRQTKHPKWTYNIYLTKKQRLNLPWVPSKIWIHSEPKRWTGGACSIWSKNIRQKVFLLVQESSPLPEPNLRFFSHPPWELGQVLMTTLNSMWMSTHKSFL